MNIFFLSRNVQECAQAHCDKHVVKMIVEYAQLLSTAHRVLDGKHQIVLVNNRKQQQWELPGEFYKASHVNHPDNVWVRESSGNYAFLYRLFIECCMEYTRRYGRVHATQAKAELLCSLPKNIPQGPFTDPPPTMPDEYKADDVVTSYQNLYVGSKARFARWTNRRPPEWFIQRTTNYDPSHFERTHLVDASPRESTRRVYPHFAS